MAPTATKAPRYYVPLMDWWVALGIGSLILLYLGGIVVCGLYAPWPAKAFAILVFLFLIVSVVDKAFFTRYALTPQSLVISSQLRHVELSYRQMAKIRPGSLLGLVTRPRHKRFALAGRCYVIELGKSPYSWKSVSLSPKLSDKFLQDLVNRIDHERSSRLTRQAP